MPSWTYRSVPQNPYEDIYAAQLARLDATAVIEELTRIVRGDMVTLLCHCQSEDFKSSVMWCHLSYVASWLQHGPGIAVRKWDARPLRP
jgi:hypothetical protein